MLTASARLVFVLIASMLVLPGCQALGVGCDELVLQPLEALTDESGENLVFRARAFDAGGNPLAGLRLNVRTATRPENTGVETFGVLATGVTDEDGLMTLAHPVEDIAGGVFPPQTPLVDVWKVNFVSAPADSGAFYCFTQEPGLISPAFLEDVNTGQL